MDSRRNLLTFASSEWIEVLIKEYESEVRVEACWPTILLNSPERQMVWSVSSILGVKDKGVPGCACRLLERYLSSHVRTFLQESRNAEEWARYKSVVSSRFHLLTVSCVMLAGKMSDLQAPLDTATVRDKLLKAGIEGSTREIVVMEMHVFKYLEYRIPLWNTLEIAEFLAAQMGMTATPILKALGLIIDLTEYYRDILEMHMKNWMWDRRCSTNSPPTRSNRVTLHNLHVCAGAVIATARYMNCPHRELDEKLGTMLRAEPRYIKAMSNTIVMKLLYEASYAPILKKRRLI